MLVRVWFVSIHRSKSTLALLEGTKHNSCPYITFMVKCVTLMVSQVITLNISHLLHLCFFYSWFPCHSFFFLFFSSLLPQTLYPFCVTPQNTTSCAFIERIYWELQRVFCNVVRSSSVLDFGSEPIRDILVISLIIRGRLLCVWLQRQTTAHRTPGSRFCKNMLRGGG